VVADHVGDRPLLLVLDNCEHVIAASASFVDEVLSTLPAVIVLATSREPLSVPGEIVWRVPSLGVPDPLVPQTVESIRVADAARLFVERARRAQPDLLLTDEAAGAIARICSRLMDSAVDRVGRRPAVATSLEQIARSSTTASDCCMVPDGEGHSRHSRRRSIELRPARRCERRAASAGGVLWPVHGRRRRGGGRCVR
jgi:hypothetical protein